MKKILLGICISVFLLACNSEKKEDKTASTDAVTTTAPTENKTAGDELLPASEGDGVKNSVIAFSKGDIDAMTSNYDDNVHFLWSNGDSMVGKKVVQDYYKGRWKLIDSLNYSDHIVVALNMRVQQSKFAPTGKWVLIWSFAHVKYKNGKKLDFWVHNVYHHNDAGKIDFIGQYIDRHPIMEATKDMMK